VTKDQCHLYLQLHLSEEHICRSPMIQKVPNVIQKGENLNMSGTDLLLMKIHLYIYMHGRHCYGNCFAKDPGSYPPCPGLFFS
jgi:hypothetical protein